MQEISIQVDKLLNSNANGIKNQEKFNEEYKKLELEPQRLKMKQKHLRKK